MALKTASDPGRSPANSCPSHDLQMRHPLYSDRRFVVRKLFGCLGFILSRRESRVGFTEYATLNDREASINLAVYIVSIKWRIVMSLQFVISRDTWSTIGQHG